MNCTNLTTGRAPSAPMFVMWRGERLQVVGIFENGFRLQRGGTTFTAMGDELELAEGSVTPPCFKGRKIRKTATPKFAPQTLADERELLESNLRLDAAEASLANELETEAEVEAAAREMDEYDVFYAQ